jgi:hypothetical protein
MNLGDHPGAGRRNRTHGLLGFQFHERLVLVDHLALSDQDADHRAALYTFGELGKFYVHGVDAAAVRLKDGLSVKREWFFRIDIELTDRGFDDLRWKGLFLVQRIKRRDGG